MSTYLHVYMLAYIFVTYTPDFALHAHASLCKHPSGCVCVCARARACKYVFVCELVHLYVCVMHGLSVSAIDCFVGYLCVFVSSCMYARVP